MSLYMHSLPTAFHRRNPAQGVEKVLEINRFNEMGLLGKVGRYQIITLWISDYKRLPLTVDIHGFPFPASKVA